MTDTGMSEGIRPPAPPQPGPWEGWPGPMGPFVPAPPPVWAKPPTPSALPVVPRAYHEFYRAHRFRWWKPLAAVGLVGGAWFLISIVMTFPVMMIDLSSGAATMEQYASGNIPATPLMFLANNLTIIAFIPLAILAHRLIFGQRAGFLASIQGRFRWRLLGRFLLIALPFFAALFVAGLITGGTDGLAVDGHTLPMIAIILLTTPFQCAGEEYAIRGLLARSVGSWFPARNFGWAVSAIVSSGVFVALHNAGDIWLNLFYACFALTGSVLVWRTGGLEAGIAIHVANNMMSLALVPFMDMSGLFDRQAGTGSPWDLIQVVFIVAPAAVIVWQAKRLALPTATAPVERPLLMAAPAADAVVHG